jgi:aminoglycoside phosphotransferase (APT) family kinase protein
MTDPTPMRPEPGQATSRHAAEVAAPPGLDLDALARHLEGVVEGGLAGPLHARVIPGGRSNLTYDVDDGRHRWVLRRPPLGHVLETAHDMGREFRVLRALAGTPVPVPPVVTECADPTVIGAPFYVMEHVDGVILRTDEQLEGLTSAQAEALAGALVDVLAELHLVDPERVGLGDFGRPQGYLERQLRRWAKQFAASHSRDLPSLGVLAEHLGAAIPRSQRGCTVHGDYRLDNVILDSASVGRILAVLDWEMATLGDPLTDLGLLLMYWDGWSGIENPITSTPGDHAAFPGRDVLAARYAERTGLDLSDLDWYLGFAFYKLAVILEGIHYRHAQGLTVGEGFERIGEMVPVLAERGMAAIGA